MQDGYGLTVIWDKGFGTLVANKDRNPAGEGAWQGLPKTLMAILSGYGNAWAATHCKSKRW